MQNNPERLLQSRAWCSAPVDPLTPQHSLRRMSDWICQSGASTGPGTSGTSGTSAPRSKQTCANGGDAADELSVMHAELLASQQRSLARTFSEFRFQIQNKTVHKIIYADAVLQQRLPHQLLTSLFRATHSRSELPVHTNHFHLFGNH